MKTEDLVHHGRPAESRGQAATALSVTRRKGACLAGQADHQRVYSECWLTTIRSTRWMDAVAEDRWQDDCVVGQLRDHAMLADRLPVKHKTAHARIETRWVHRLSAVRGCAGPHLQNWWTS